MGGAGSAIFLADQIARHLVGPQDRDTMDEREDAAVDLGIDLQTLKTELNNARLLGFDVDARPEEGPASSGAP